MADDRTTETTRKKPWTPDPKKFSEDVSWVRNLPSGWIERELHLAGFGTREELLSRKQADAGRKGSCF